MKFFKRSILISLTFVIAFSLAGTTTAQAESSAVQKAIDGVKTSLDTLVGAKDENSQNELQLKINTFKKVLELALTEAKDMRIKLLSFDTKDTEVLLWRDAQIAYLKLGIDYFRAQAGEVEKQEKTLTLESIRTMAQSFKTWREENYLGTLDQISTFFLITQEQQATQIAQKRYQKVSTELASFIKKNLVKTQGIQKMLGNVDILIGESNTLNNKAWNLFHSDYILPLFPNQNPELDEIATTTTSTTPISIPVITNASTTATTTLPILPTPSIRDLVRDSLQKIRDAYQIFIDMSSSVRELLK